MDINSSRTDGYYIKSRREKGQQKIFKCKGLLGRYETRGVAVFVEE